MRDLLARRWSQLRERLGGNRGWLHELSRYYHGLTEPEFWVRYTLGRQEAAKLWDKKPRRCEADYRAFYAESDYWVLRQMYYHRHSSFHWIERHLPQQTRFCEYGSGVGPITAWLRRRHPEWSYTLVELPSDMLVYAQWRFPEAEILTPGLGDDLPLRGQYDAIACLDVLEHVINPYDVVRHLVEHLRPGGHLFINFEKDEGRDENLAESAAERDLTIAYLNATLRSVRPLHVAGPEEHRGHYVNA